MKVLSIIFFAYTLYIVVLSGCTGSSSIPDAVIIETISDTQKDLNLSKPDPGDSKQTCHPAACWQIGKECGEWDDSCGGLVDCGSCGKNHHCEGGTCINTEFCGNGLCNGSWEDCSTCPQDCACGDGNVCMNGVCCSTENLCRSMRFECGEAESRVRECPSQSCGLCPEGKICVDHKCIKCHPWDNCGSLNDTDGKVWLSSYKNNFQWTGQAMDTDGNIYVTDEKAKLLSFHASDGRLRWMKYIKGNIVGGPSVGPGNLIHIVTTHPESSSADTVSVVWTIKSDGTIIRTTDIRAELAGNPAVTEDGDVYIAGNGLYRVSKEGKADLVFPDNGYFMRSPAIGRDGTIYVGCDDYRLYAVQPDGSLKWTFSFSGPVLVPPSIGPDSTIYIATLGGIMALRPDGNLLWKHKMDVKPGYIFQPVIGPDGTVYVSSTSKDGTLTALSAKDGTVKWAFAPPEPVKYLPEGWKTAAGPPLVDREGRIYLARKMCFDCVNQDGTLAWEILSRIYLNSGLSQYETGGSALMGSKNIYIFNYRITAITMKYGPASTWSQAFGSPSHNACASTDQ